MEAPEQRPPRDWLILGQERWDDVERRNQLLVRALATRNARTRFLFAEIPLRPSEARGWRRPRLRRVADNIWVFQPIRPLPDRIKAAADAAEAAQVSAAMRRLGISRPRVWTQDSRTLAIIERLAVGPIAYDLTDDWAAFEPEGAAREATQRRIEALGARADVVFACSRSLEQGARAWADPVVYLPNAVEAPGPHLSEPADLAALPRPRLAYVGTQHSSRLDVEQIVAAATARPGWSFVLLGPDMLEEPERSRLHDLPNVAYLGVRPHAEVQAYLQHVDVCLITHLVNDFTRSLDPLKLYEYLAAGRPVISTALDYGPDLGAEIRVASDAEALVRVAEDEIRDDSAERRDARRAMVLGETWDARAAAVERDFDEGRIARRPGVCVAIVSYNTEALLRRCLADVYADGFADLDVVVVDNGSTDGSVAMVRAEFPDVRVIDVGENLGFGRANNLAFETCDREFFLLLNSDAFVTPGSIAALVAVARHHPRAAAIGPRLHNEDGTLQRSAWPFPAAGRLLAEAVGLHRPLRSVGWLEDLGTWAHDTQRPVDFLVGACLLMRSAAYAEVNGFDESFPLYAEEADLQRRLADRGWESVLAPTVEVTHIGGASSTVDTRRLASFYGGQRRYLQRHGGAGAWPIARIALLIGALLRRRWPVARYALRPQRDELATQSPAT